MALAKWSKDSFGDIFKQLAIWEEVVKLKEKNFEDNTSSENRGIVNKAHAEFTKYLKYEEDFWRQKSGMQWFSEGDRNTSFFYNVVERRRKRLEVKRIQRLDGSCAEGPEVMSEAVSFF